MQHQRSMSEVLVSGHCSNPHSASRLTSRKTLPPTKYFQSENDLHSLPEAVAVIKHYHGSYYTKGNECFVCIIHDINLTIISEIRG